MEGHDLQLGWHAFLWYGRTKSHKYFERNIIRNSLLRVWERVKTKIYMKIPRWVSSMEAFTYPNLLKFEKIITYNELLNIEGKLKTKSQLESQGIYVAWLPWMQIQTTYNQDLKAQGSYKEQLPFDKVLINTEDKQIKGLYKLLLQWDT